MFLKRSQKVAKILPIYDYTKEVLEECKINLNQMSNPLVYSPIPPRELCHKGFDYDTDIAKSEDPLKLTFLAKDRLNIKYQLHLKVYTDGSVSDKKKEVRAGFIIPYFGIHKSIYLDIDYSV